MYFRANPHPAHHISIFEGHTDSNWVEINQTPAKFWWFLLEQGWLLDDPDWSIKPWVLCLDSFFSWKLRGHGASTSLIRFSACFRAISSSLWQGAKPWQQISFSAKTFGKWHIELQQQFKPTRYQAVSLPWFWLQKEHLPTNWTHTYKVTKPM